MDIALLSALHPTCTPEVWARYDALYRGGEAIRPHLDHFLPRNPQEVDDIYQARKREAHYTGYVGPVCDWFSAKLFSASIVVRARAEDAPAGEHLDSDPFYSEWKEDVDGAGTDLVDFVRARFTAALVKGLAWWLVELPDDEADEPANRAHWEARGLGNATVAPLEREQVLDWEADAHGELLWAVVYSLETPRPTISAARGRVREMWRVYDRVEVITYVVEYDPAKEQRPTSAVLMSQRPHRFSRVPLVRLGFAGVRGVRVRVGGRLVSVSAGALEGFWLLARLADPQIAHFRSGCALDWNIKRTCYAMPVFEIGDDEQPPTMGTGYFIRIARGDKVTWTAPPTEHLAVLADRVTHLKDEIYRVANQLAQGVSNNAAAVGRSGQSKQVDLDSTEVVLRVYGALAREAIERTYSLLAEGRGDEVEWSIEGLDVFSLADAGAVTTAATLAQTLAIPSVTLRRELFYRVADALVPNADQKTKDAIRAEIDEGVTAEVELREAERPPPVVVEDEQEPEAAMVPPAREAA